MPEYKLIHTGPKIDEGISRALPGGALDVALAGQANNKTLLRNGDFRKPVNLRGLDVYLGAHSGIYTIDGWKGDTPWGGIPTTVTLSAGVGITISNTPNSQYPSAYGVLKQIVENPAHISGKTVTFSADITGVAASNEGTYPSLRLEDSNGVVSVPVNSTGIVSLTRTLGTISSLNVGFSTTVGSTTSGSLSVKRCKLEIGSVSTLANDPPANYGEQLALCQRYYRLWTDTNARTEALKSVGLMRLASPTLGTQVIGGTTYYSASADL